MDPGTLAMVRAIGETGSMSAAARQLGYSQPAVSQQVRRLEHRLGTALVERAGRRVRLTEAGSILARHATPLLAGLAAAEEEVAAVAGLRAGRVRLVAFPSSSATLVPRALRLLRDRHPGVVVSFSEAEPPQSLSLLREGACDVAVAFTYPGTDLGRGVDDLRGLVATPLRLDRMHLALPADHTHAGSDTVTLADLATETWIAGCPRCRGHLLSACQRAGFTPDIAFETDDYVAVLGLVAAGLGVAMIPGLVVESAHHQDVVMTPVNPASHRHVLAVTSADLRRVPAVAAMVATLEEAAG